MIPKDCKRLAEVDFPIAAVSKHAAKEKSIRHGHPSTLHLWWARRPLAACRAILLGLLLPDPCDKHCPADFKKKARELLPQVVGKIGSKDEDLRHALLKFIGDFANWDRAADRVYLEVSRGLVKAGHGKEPPLVVDPFAGGGSIPLEALRLGCETFASDLNPVACLIQKVLLEDIPRHGIKLAEELRKVGKEIKSAMEKELAEFYPSYKDGARPIAYLWARTVRCESPNCGAEIPLVRSFWLCNRGTRKRALLYKVIRRKGDAPRVEFEIFEPKNDQEVPPGTVSRAKATCLCCLQHTVVAPDRVRAQLREQHGGADIVFDTKGQRVGGAWLLAIVTLKTGEQGRHYRLPTAEDYMAVLSAQRAVSQLSSEALPIEEIPRTELRRLSVPLYGISMWKNLFTARQNLALATFTKYIREVDPSVSAALSCVLTKLADKQSTLCGWKTTAEYMGTHTFSRQALGMVWDFCEANPLGAESGSISQELGWVSEVYAMVGNTISMPGTTQMADACTPILPSESAAVWFTDPPYYDSVPYAHLADFFYVWLRRSLATNLREWFQTPLTPKDDECVVDRPHSLSISKKTAKYFENKMQEAMRVGRKTMNQSGIGCIVFAHKTTEGWEALLSGMINAGWMIVASWPITTEMSSRLNARETAALAASIHLICRPRPNDATIGDWSEVLRELASKVGDWMERLQAEGVRGADLVFACIGPTMEVYSSYSKVEDAEGREIPLGGDPTAAEPYKRGFLAYVWETVGRTALGQILGTAEARARNGIAGALEEDARLTALFLWTLQATDGESAKANGKKAEEDDESDDEEEDGGKGAKKKGFTLIYDVARRFAQPLGIHLDQWEGRIIETEKGIVRLLPVAERAEQLFGEEGASAVADRFEASPTRPIQATLFSEEYGAMPEIKGRGKGKKAKKISAKEVSDEKLASRREATTLDRVHAAMLLQASGRANALRALLKSEQERGPDFLRLANALSALYPKDSEEKRVLDAMLLAVPR